jgi:hypothetical protein
LRGLVIANTNANIDGYERAYNEAQAPLPAPAPAAGDGQATTQGAVDQQRAQQASANLQAAGQNVREGLAELQSFGLPLGYVAFPFCVGPQAPQLDPRCNGDSAETVSVLGAMGRLGDSRDGWLWVLSVLLAGGLIGLGAPFWYQVFRRLARVVPGAESVRAVVQSEVAAAPTARRQAVRDAGSAAPDSLLLAFDVASGNVAQSIIDPSIQTALDPPGGGRGGGAGASASVTRVVHGDGSVVTIPGATRHLR